MLISKLEVTPGFADKFLDMFRSAFQVSVDFHDFKIAQIIVNHLKSQLRAGSMVSPATVHSVNREEIACVTYIHGCM